MGVVRSLTGKGRGFRIIGVVMEEAEIETTVG
jgi:hypothetical protein